MALHFHPLVVGDICRETSDCVSIAFKIPGDLQKEFSYKQGQNITIKTDKDDVRRSYSICSSPTEDELRIAVKMVPNGVFSTFANKQLKRGDVLEVMPPTGNFFTPVKKGQKKNYVFFAAGSGITPIISNIKTILNTEEESEVTLVYGNKNVASIIFKESLEALKDKYLRRFRIFYILSRERTDADLNYGRIDADKCQQLAAAINYSSADEYFICGPEAMIFSVKEFLELKGITSGKIHFELFTTPTRKHTRIYNAADDKNTEGSKVSVTVDGRSFDFFLGYNSNTILDEALAQGADLPFACKGGVCTTCRAKLLEGKVEMEANYGLEESEVKDGYILTCQSHPRSDRVVVNFDVL